MAVVPDVLLDHVHQHLVQRDRARGSGTASLKSPSGSASEPKIRGTSFQSILALNHMRSNLGHVAYNPSSDSVAGGVDRREVGGAETGALRFEREPLTAHIACPRTAYADAGAVNGRRG